MSKLAEPQQELFFGAFKGTNGLTQGNLRQRVELAVADLKQATEVIVRNHYLHRGRTMAQLAYWILLDGIRVGVLLFSYPRMSVEFHGYRPMSILELARMWIDPSVQGVRVTDSKGRKHAFSVASCAVGKSLRRVRRDWHGKYPHLPDILVVVSWADQEHHEGTIYKAANFRKVGTSGGSLHGSTHRRNGGRDQLNPDYQHMKTTFIYEFQAPLSVVEKSSAVRDWTKIRPQPLRRRGNRVLPDELTQVQSRLALEPDSVFPDIR